MSMLAEPRRKQKVINLRAKNNVWSNDSTKFGQRMLEKMGWSSGKGLGAKENGIVEHVVARYKNDEKGLGFEDRNDQWTKHEDDFNSLLANLSNAEVGTETSHSGISLEKKSKKSKARIHYHKFTRGKDLSRYSEKDLANIFGKKSFKEPESTESIKEDTVKTTEQVFTEKGNMDDYFKTKLAAIKSKQLNTDTNSQDYQASDYAFQGFSNTKQLENKQTGFGYQPFSFDSSLKEDVIQNIELTCPGNEPKSKKKKSRQKDISREEIIEGNNLPESNHEVTQKVEMDVATKVKKSKKKIHIESYEESQLLYKVDSSECLQDMGVVSTKVKKSKKKKHKECTEDTQSPDTEDNYSEYIQFQNKESSKKSKKKKHQESAEEEIQLCEVISELKKNKKNRVGDIQDHLSTEDSVPKKKKKRKNLDL